VLNTVHNAIGFFLMKEALEIFKRTGNIKWQMQSAETLAWLLVSDKQLEAAEDIASREITLVTDKSQEIHVCRFHRVLGNIYRSKGEKKKAIYHLETAIGIASLFNWHDELFWNHYGLVILFLDEGEFDHANTHTEQAKSHAVNDGYKLGRATELQADVWHRQLRFEEARSEALHALEIYEKLGAVRDAGFCKDFLRIVEQATKDQSTSFQGELLETKLYPTSVDFHFLA
jgi:tetratricopeptide (TPR) repeat protein